MTSSQLLPALIVPLVAWRLYRRFRRNVGRQTYVPRRLILVVSVVALLTVGFGLTSARQIDTFFGLVTGWMLGGGLGLVGLKLTTFDEVEGKRFYTPHAYIGVGVTLLFVGRLAYRFSTLYPLAGAAPDAAAFNAGQSPLTLLLLGVTLGYYAVFCGGVLRHFRPA